MSIKMKKCTACGEEIAANAKSCPKCGAPNKKPVYKRWWFWGIIIVFLVSILSSGGSENPGEDVKVDETVSSNGDAVEQVESYLWIAENADPAFELSEKSIAFIEEHTDFFPGDETNKGAISDYVDEEITYAHMAKNISKYGDCLFSVYGYVVDIQEAEDGSLTYLHIVDYDDKSYTLYYLGVLDDVFENSEVYVYALPFEMTTFENLAGAYTEAVIGAACYVELLY